MPRVNPVLARGAVSVLAGAVDAAVGISIAILLEAGRRAWFDAAGGASHLALLLFAVALFTVSNAMRGDYALANYLSMRRRPWRSFHLWTVAVACAAAVGFATMSAGEIEWAGLALFYAFGLAGLYAARSVVGQALRAGVAAGNVSAKRVFLVGLQRDTDAFIDQHEPSTCGVTIEAAVVLRDAANTLDEDLKLAAASARMLRPDDIYILAPWSRRDVIEACVTAFLRVPAQLHLGPDGVLNRFADARVDRIGSISSLSLGGHALNPAEVLAKRVFDIVASALGLILLSPLLLVFAALIKLDSKGPVVFKQRRYGFNQEPFDIFKFRSMTTLENGRIVMQATANDSRVTRIGRLMRRTNIDELPQLLNVLRGDMSLVGPRPHALAHDQQFERKIALYARRHNMKPGITGWAQVNGLRGEVDTPEKIRRRVEHDLYYIDNWSFWLDLWIVFLTIFSRKAYRNAW